MQFIGGGITTRTPGSPSSANPANLADVGGTLFCSGDDGRRGVALWHSDGTGERGIPGVGARPVPTMARATIAA